MENQDSGLALIQNRQKRHPNAFYEAIMGTKQIINSLVSYRCRV
ncbi:Uncharacterized protein BN1183_AO_00080 [Pantoea ananatis]|nr:Uncharacterized protein BN1183_AO_00080 [Pantoea ananatis]